MVASIAVALAAPRGALKGLLERLLMAVTAGRRFRSSRGQCLILAYHNIVPPGSPPFGDASLHLPLDSFCRQLDALQSGTRLVPLDVALRDGGGEDDRPTVAITFDDGYLGAVEYGVRELKCRGLPATFFVCPGLANGQAVWWDALADRRTGSVAPAVRRHALTALGGEQQRVRAWAMQEGLAWQEVPDVCRIADEATLLRATGSSGVSLGAHTWSHPNLGALPPEGRRADLAQVRKWLSERRTEVSSALAYPYGIPPREPQPALEEAGYSHGLLVAGGWHRWAATDRWRVSRFNVAAGLSAAGFQLRLAGWLLPG